MRKRQEEINKMFFKKEFDKLQGKKDNKTDYHAYYVDKEKSLDEKRIQNHMN